ncbi:MULTISPECIES: type IV conjugative transfer system coupling protein TraD [Achromobacter]|uniref:Conjugative coupling factor TraD, PFGI-1 class n=1 Tax=Achromobacter spanius TaxID=217203 RepID=A0A2K8S0F2_9BURK|nr:MULTISPECIES: type IV conjugative transfer system coupling protein TraD [Achromobacter]AUA56064.1 conjugative coupling factor TraD, PFGI-1 class [Achromobacter spanius]MDH0735495.1 type IV conjugative transfer system coupling protein TraD [Achromobacter spanius]PPA77607.1 conjugative coupling factor TraD, PFGI-1 class [Achromobacter spanius]QYJ21263.1 type IV conjugative transfer system coupling protein TraD [Achromobacter sp. ES-001]
MSHPYENLFRRPYEVVSSMAALASVGALWTYQGLFLVTPATGGVLSVGLLSLAAIRARQARRLIRFQRNLRSLPTYSLAADEIPCSSTELFLGKGFYWTQEHTQRLYTARLPQYKHLTARNELYQWARRMERQHPGWIANQLKRDAWWNSVKPLPPVGGDPVIHGVEPDERDIWSSLGERVGHTLVLGTTRVGKTRLCELLVTQDIRRGDVVIVFDPKGDVELLLRMYAEACRAGREKDFHFFHLGYPDASSRYSPIATFSRITEVATRLAGQLPSEGQAAAFREFVWRYINVMARAMVALGMKPSYEVIYQNAVNIDDLCLKYFEYWLDRDHMGWRDEMSEPDKQLQAQAQKTGRAMYPLQILKLIRDKGWHDQIADGLASVLTNDRSYFEKLVSSLYPLLEKLTTGPVSKLLSPDYSDPSDPRTVFDWQKIIDTGGIVYVGLDALSDFEVAGAVGNSMFADLTSTAGRLYKFGSGYGQAIPGKKRNVCIHADEFNELVGDEFIPMVNKAGGAGYQVTAYTQTGSDVESRIGSKAKADQIFGNFNTLVMLRVKNLPTAEILTDQLPKVQIYTRQLDSATGDGTDDGVTDFTSRTQDKYSPREVPLVDPSDLVQLPKGQAFALIEGGQLVKLRLPLASKDSDHLMPAGLADVVKSMRSTYKAYSDAVDAGLSVDMHDFDSTVSASERAGEVSSNVTVEGSGRGF